MNSKPLSKQIYTKAKELGVEQIILRFSGGNDEGFLDIETAPWNVGFGDFHNEIEEWAWETYSYSGAGEGNDYGDNVIYDLKNGRVSTNEWYTSTSEGYSSERNLQIEA